MYATLPAICRKVIYQFLLFVRSPDKYIFYVGIYFSHSDYVNVVRGAAVFIEEK
jgi:hypothetical protein